MRHSVRPGAHHGAFVCQRIGLYEIFLIIIFRFSIRGFVLAKFFAHTSRNPARGKPHYALHHSLVIPRVFTIAREWREILIQI